MALLGNDIQNLNDLFVHTLQDIYYAEKKIEKALPEMMKKASAAPLRQVFSSHLEETHTHVARLGKVFEMCNLSTESVNCPAINGIIEEAEEISSEIGDGDTMDAALAAAAQAVEHYEISRYGTLVAWARELGRSDVAEVLEETLGEEKAADAKLNELAMERLNRAA